MNELVSVIIPLYNKEKYIKRCIDSLVKQTYKNLQIIIVDDGSTDNSTDIISQYKDEMCIRDRYTMLICIQKMIGR